MTIYEFITPSDPITFLAPNDKIAYLCSVFLGSGKAGCTNTETGESVPSMLMFVEEPDKAIEEYVGEEVKGYIEKHKQEMSDCFNSFAYATVSARRMYDDAIEAITDPEKLKQFKSNHEDKNRSSMSKWVQSAWKYAESFLKIENE